MTLRQHRSAALVLLLVLGSLLLFLRLGGGPIEIYDEGLYGMYARDALHFDVWQHAVDATGRFPTGLVKFSKPPLSIWISALSMQAFGPSLFALRFPFALCSLAIALLAFAWGAMLDRGVRGVWLGFAWGMAWLLCHGTYHYGRTATIEPVLIAFVMLALYAYARSLRVAPERNRALLRSLGWAALAGLGVAGAFFTKQLVCALAIAPIGLTELVLLTRARLGRAVLRLVFAVGAPLAAAGAWLYLLWEKVGRSALAVLWQHAVVTRVEGFDGLHHRNYLNRVIDQLDIDFPPLSWQLGILGLGLFFAAKERRREPDGWLLGFALLSAWLTFDVGSHAILPWYVMTMLPVLAFGNAWLATRALAAIGSGFPDDPLERWTVGAGAATCVFALGLVARSFMPAMLAASLCVLACVLCLQHMAPAAVGGGASGLVSNARIWQTIAGVGCSLLLLCGALSRDSYRLTESDPYSTIAEAFSAQHAQRVSLDDRLREHTYTRITFFGPLAENGGQPWLRHSKTSRRFDARIEGSVLPRELPIDNGLKLTRAPGMIGFYGNLSKPPFAPDAATKVLAKRPLTFEAEDLASDMFYTRKDERGASAGVLRRVDPRLREPLDSFWLARGTSAMELPIGEYLAKFYVQRSCKGFRGQKLGTLAVNIRGAGRSAQQDLDCHGLRDSEDSADDAALVPIELAFRIMSPAQIEVSVRYEQGALAFDRVTIEYKPIKK